jgi:antitoxin component YwqK of YwqJK toxin-antitoxin module
MTEKQGIEIGTYTETGNRFCEIQHKDGKKEGQYVSFHKDGITIGTVGQMKNDKPDGLWTSWDEDGVKIAEEYFEDGELVSDELFLRPSEIFDDEETE